MKRHIKLPKREPVGFIDVKRLKPEILFTVNLLLLQLFEPHREKTGFLLMRKQRRRSASR